jgi:hypothetical protein
MRWFNGFRIASPLQAAVINSIEGGEDLSDKLHELEEYPISSRGDALTICRALEIVVEGELAPDAFPLQDLIFLFQNVKNSACPAFSVLHDTGIPLLIRLVSQGLRQRDRFGEQDLLCALKVLAFYGTADGATMILKAARAPLAPHSYTWHLVFRAFGPEHPETARLLSELSHPLPESFIAVALLDAANQYRRQKKVARHPFDSTEGLARLKTYLRSTHDDSYGVSAAAAIPFLTGRGRSQLLNLALKHANPTVAMEAAWAAAKLGNRQGIATLSSLCLDLNFAEQARQYLEELGLKDSIPEAARDPGFRACAEFSHWLAHPSELGRKPDQLTIVDHRQLPWPPAREPIPCWLIQYRAQAQSDLDEDDVGIGMVGSMTFCFFDAKLNQRPLEDIYALYCGWEMAVGKLLKIDTVTPASHEYDSCLNQWTGGTLEHPAVTAIAELNPDLKYGRRLVALASATLAGNAGWVVLDGPQSHWYPATEFAPQESSLEILKLHLGRQLLNLGHATSRTPWVKPSPTLQSGKIVDAYSRLLSRFNETTLAPDEWEKLAQQIKSHFETYLEALDTLHPEAQGAFFVPLYEQVLAAARRAEPILGEETFDIFSVIGAHFEQYVQAKIQGGHGEEVLPLIELLTPKWRSNLGYSLLGRAAYQLKAFALAEPFFLKLKASLKNWKMAEDMGMLAAIWWENGQAKRARALLLECLAGVLAQSRKQDESCEAQFQSHRRMYLKLFPKGESTLASHGIPPTTEPGD